jgi:hypothetical protein
VKIVCHKTDFFVPISSVNEKHISLIPFPVSVLINICCYYCLVPPNFSSTILKFCSNHYLIHFWMLTETKKKPQISTKKHIGIDPVRCQAAVPEWINDPSEECKANYRNDNDTLQRMGTVVRLPPTLEPPKARKAVNDMCKCYHPGSEAYVEVNVKEAWKRVKYQLGEQAFKNCGFGAMGERVLKLWTAEDKKKLADFEKLIPQSKSTIEDFMEVALKQFSSERTTDLAKYCYNVFLPRRFASLNRAGSTNSIDAISDDEGNSQDDNKVHLSEENGKSSGSSLKR